MSVAELEVILAKKKEGEIDVLRTEIDALETTLTNKKSQLSKLTGVPETRGQQLVRKYKNAFPPRSKAPKKAKAKRGAVGESIAAFLASKGKAGAHVKDIAAAIGNKPANVTAFFYSPGGKAKYKNLGKATFALKK